MSKSIKITFLLIVSWMLGHLLFITIDGLSDNYKKADALLILGNTVHENGIMSDRLKGRVDKGLQLYNHGFANKIIVSGGLGKEGHYEAEVMKNYLLENKVPLNNIIVDNYGNTTYLSAKNYTSIMKQYDLHSLIVVSQFHHLSRASLIFHKLKCGTIYTAHAEYFEWRDIFSSIREFFGYYKYLIYY